MLAHAAGGCVSSGEAIADSRSDAATRSPPDAALDASAGGAIRDAVLDSGSDGVFDASEGVRIEDAPNADETSERTEASSKGGDGGADASSDGAPDGFGDTDSDGDGVPDGADECPSGITGWTSSPETDLDGDGCRDRDEDSAVWVPVDLHTHADQCDGLRHTPREMASLMDISGIRLASVLLWGSWTDDLPFLTGIDDPVSSAARILHFDVEISAMQAATGGHLLLLGLPAGAISEVWTDPGAHAGGSGVPVVDTGFGRLAALRGMAHTWTWPPDGTFPAPPLGCCMALELPVHVARKTIDFLSTEYDFEDPTDTGSLAVWERLLQSGFEIPFVPASDWSCLQPRMGAMRSLAMISGSLSYGAVLSAVKAGRVVAVGDDTGRRLDMRIDGARIGDRLDVAAGSSLDVEMRVMQPEAGPLKLIVNGQVVHEEALPAGRQIRKVPLSLSRSSWIRASTWKATTNPIYVTVGHAPIRPSSDAPCYFMRYLDHLSDLVRSGAVDLGVDQPTALAAYAEARGIFETRFTEALGQQCP